MYLNIGIRNSSDLGVCPWTYISYVQTFFNSNYLFYYKLRFYHFDTKFYYIPITDTSIELSVFWLSDTESRINELRFSDSVSLSFKTRLKSVTCFCDDVA